MELESPLEAPTTSSDSSSLQSQDAFSDENAEAMMNLSLLDPPHWGWSAAGGVVDLLPPHERARRKATKSAYLRTLSERVKNKGSKPKSAATSKAVTPVVSKMPNASEKGLQSLEKSNVELVCRPEKQVASILKPVEFGELSITETPSNEAITRTSLEEHSTNDITIESGSSDQASVSALDLLALTSDISVGTNTKIPCVATPAPDALTCEEKSKPAAASVTTESKILNDDEKSKQNEPLVEATNTLKAPLPNLDEQSLKVDLAEKNKKEDGIIVVRAMSETGVLDMYTYHRGREGLELRDEDSGELLCDVEASDTNHRWDQPRMKTAVTISFPLSDPDDGEDDNCETDDAANTPQDNSNNGPFTTLTGANPLDGMIRREQRRQAAAQFREIVEWDLADPKTPTAMAFASGVAVEFGLDYGQTMDLASSIQKQLDDFVRNSVVFNVPLSYCDPYGTDRAFAPLVPPGFASTPNLYGKFSCSGKAGIGLRNPGAQKQRFKAANTTNSQRKATSSSIKAITHEIVPAHLLPKHDGPAPLKANTGRAVTNNVKFSSELEYRQEVLKRALAVSKQECKRVAEVERGDTVKHVSNHVCHICHARKPHCALFPCGTASHAYCEFHCTSRLGFSIVKRETQPIILDHCPICALKCVCPKCARRLDSVAHHLKEEAKYQGTKVENTEIEDSEIHKLCSGNRPSTTYTAVSKASSRRESLSDIKPEEREKLKLVKKTSAKEKNSRVNLETEKPEVVPKVLATEFPREVSGGRDVDPASPDDYRTIFSQKGNFILVTENGVGAKPVKEVSAHSTDDSTEIEEDGNVDYCHICKKHGNLLCCDRCPRAFHGACIGGVDIPDRDWECHVCVKENTGLPNDLLDGETSMDVICATLVEFNYSDGFVANTKLLSMIHEMVIKLMDYEFGELFCVPVDDEVVPGYKAIVKHPIDLGTIVHMLENGVYAKRYHTNQSWDDVQVAILQDIELVWHNCFVFNFEGSAIYRMAEVHRRRCNEIQKRSFTHLLSESVKNRVQDYIAERNKERGAVSAQVSNSKPDTDSQQSRRQNKGRHKIAVPFTHGGSSRKVAVFDPDSSLVVKLYRSMKGASLAVACLSENGHKPEFFPMNENLVKEIIRRSSKDPSLTIFGYRWLYLDDLRDRRVRFTKNKSSVRVKSAIKKIRKSPSIFVEMTHGGNKFVFISVEEAMSSPFLPDSVPVAELKRRLLGQTPGEPFSFMDRTWRTLLPKNTNEHDKKDQLKGEEKESNNNKIALNPIADGFSSWCFRKDMLEKAFPPSVIIVKEDFISGRKLLGFGCVKGAYQDWLATRESTPEFSESEPKTVEYFDTHYLDGVRNIDGVFWKTCPKVSTILDSNVQSGIIGQIEMTKSNKNSLSDTTGSVPAGTNISVDTSGSTHIENVTNDPNSHLLSGRYGSEQFYKAPSNPAKRMEQLVGLYQKKSVGVVPNGQHVTQKGAPVDRRETDMQQRLSAPLLSNGGTPSNNIQKSGVKRDLSDEGTVDKNTRVTKKLAIRSA